MSDAEPRKRHVRKTATSRLQVAPSMGPAASSVGVEDTSPILDRRAIGLAALAGAIGVVAALLAELLTACISLLTNLAFFGRFSLETDSPVGNALGGWVVLVPIAGALVVGLMARFGSAAIRGHGIPEAMEQVLYNESRIPARVLFLKPISAVISIGTGGPFGAEGPIIATGGALGSIVGQLSRISPDERKMLLAAGAAGGMAATFGSPVSAVLLAVELLLFEYRARSLVPVALAAVVASGVRIAFEGTAPAFVVLDLPAPTPASLVAYTLIGLVAGFASVGITKAVYAVEDAFARLPVHWMWWPAIGAVPVGIIGLFEARTMGVGYENIEQMVSGDLFGTALVVLCALKLCSWLFSLGSGTSGGTLAPLFTIGGGIGAVTAGAIAWAAPWMGVDMRIGALVGMAALFAGASRALLTSVVFAFEATRQPLALLPLLAGCSAAYLVSCVMMQTSIMTEKIARRGRPVPSEYAVDYLSQMLVSDVGIREVSTLSDDQTLDEVRAWLGGDTTATRHQGFPVLGDDGRVRGVLMQRDILASELPGDAKVADLLRRPPYVIAPTATLRHAADTMLREGIGRLPVVDGGRLVGIVTRSDLIEGHRGRLQQRHGPARRRSDGDGDGRGDASRRRR